MFTTAYQFGCDALIALGQAEEAKRGARPLARRRLPVVLSRWDDLCVTVLSLANSLTGCLVGPGQGHDHVAT